YLRRYYSRADLVVCPSEYTKGVLEDYPVRAPVRPVTNGIDRDSMTGHEALRQRDRDRYDLSGTVVFCVGNVFERKGVAEFCEVARRTDHEFAWFGHYDTGPQASTTVRRLTSDPPENVTFTGWVEDKRGAFAAGDVLLLPAEVENQGLVVLEAMACEKPVVLSDIPVFREFFDDGEDCLRGASVPEYVDAVRDRSDRCPDRVVLQDAFRVLAGADDEVGPGVARRECPRGVACATTVSRRRPHSGRPRSRLRPCRHTDDCSRCRSLSAEVAVPDQFDVLPRQSVPVAVVSQEFGSERRLDRVDPRQQSHQLRRGGESDVVTQEDHDRREVVRPDLVGCEQVGVERVREGDGV
ncbi:hypothetical protein BRD10_03800, partial [Halobacteriales archaeon SW_12_71_31]